jgi:hypothetical protein
MVTRKNPNLWSWSAKYNENFAGEAEEEEEEEEARNKEGSSKHNKKRYNDEAPERTFALSPKKCSKTKSPSFKSSQQNRTLLVQP